MWVHSTSKMIQEEILYKALGALSPQINQLEREADQSLRPKAEVKNV
jgi:hypothetical protein